MKAINLYFAVAGMETITAGPFEYHDKIPTKKNLAVAGVRVVPPGTVRYGAFVEPGVVVMPGYVNIGAWVGSGTMVDTWATVGSGAQIGKNVHLAGGDAGRHRGRRVRRLAGRRRRGRARRGGGGPGGERGAHELDPDHRRHRRGGGRPQGPRPRPLRGRRRHAPEGVPRWLLPAPDGPHHRAAPGVNRPEDLPERGPQAVRGQRLRERLLENLLWFLGRPSVTGEEKRLCDDLEARVSRLAGWKTRRLFNNLVVRRAEPDGSR